MLTPVDIQQKKFKMGIGYDRKDVNTFFDELSSNYEELYRSNAELKERVITLTDGLQHYKSTEASLQKNLMIAEKNSQESKTNAIREAKSIKLEAKNKANEIVSQAYAELEEIQNKITELQTKYAEYKSAFATIVKQQFEILELKDFDPDAYIDPNYASMAPVSSSSSYEKTESNYSSDPQMRDSSSGLTGKPRSQSREENRSSTTSVYGSKLGGNGINPFGEKKDASKDVSQKKKTTLKTVDEREKTKPARFSASANSKNNVTEPKMSKPATDIKGSAASEKAVKDDINNTTTDAVKADVKFDNNISSAEDTSPKESSVSEEKVRAAEAAATAENISETESSVAEDISTEETITGDIQDKVKNSVMIGENADDDADTDDDGFEFI